jgi:hypothetical protein
MLIAKRAWRALQSTQYRLIPAHTGIQQKECFEEKAVDVYSRTEWLDSGQICFANFTE